MVEVDLKFSPSLPSKINNYRKIDKEKNIHENTRTRAHTHTNARTHTHTERERREREG